MSILQSVERKKGRGRRTYILIILILCIGIPIQIAPFAWMFFNSFKFPKEIIQLPPTFFPKVINWQSYAEAFEKFSLWKNLWNTLLLCGSIIFIQVTISALAAYSISKLKPKYGKLYLLLFVGTMMMSAQALMFPIYIMMVNMNMINSFWSYILVSSAWGYSIFLFKGFFDGLPNELLESAKLDGAGSFQSFTKIVIPLSKPVIMVNVLNTFIAVYNDFMLPIMLLPHESKWTMMMRIFISEQATKANKTDIFVMLTVATLPVILIYLWAQKYIVQGISMTGLKG